MNSASVEYVRGMPEIKAFNQTADSFKRLSKSITDYTSFVLEYALGWQNCMPAFTTIINNIYLFLIPVGVLIGMHTTDFREYSLPLPCILSSVYRKKKGSRAPSVTSRVL